MTILKDRRPKICYLRGSYLNPFETQYLEPLQDKYDIVAAHTKYHRFDLSDIKIPHVEFPCLDYLNGMIPRRIAGHTIPNILKYFGYEEVLFGFESCLSEYDLIQVPEQSFFFTWQIAKRKRRIGYKMITMQHEINPLWYTHKPAIVKRVRLIHDETDFFIARTQRAKSALICEGINANKIHIIGHGVDTTRFCPGYRDSELCKSLRIETDRFIILFVGQLLWTKGIYALADAANLLLIDKQIKKLDPLFLIVGSGSERSNFQKRLRQLGIDNSFLLVEKQPYNKLPDIHRLADIFVLPSISTRYVLEQFGIVLIESMATGKPVVSTYCGAIDEVVGDTGRLVQPNDYYRLAEALLELCRNESLRKHLGERGLARVKEHFTHNVVSAKLASLYREVLGR